MNRQINIYNSLTRKKEAFQPINSPFVGMYVCGPTVYGDAHLGHARPNITFDIVFRYLKHLGYKVRYVRNITDVGHLENDADHGEDKIGKKARLEQLEPMEIVQLYTTGFHKNMEELNVLSPSIEPRASGHIIEQIILVEKIIESGFAYQSNGSVYFDVNSFDKKHGYGSLSGRKIEDMLGSNRDLEGQTDKKSSIDFALWKKASPEHIMRWPSPWGEGFPGWHLECTAMSTKYLGEKFDIHGGGMDLLFPHHECEVAQSKAANGKAPANYWMHNNMITINGQKMGKSLGNFITLDQLFNNDHALVEKPYDPMTIRFFILQAHYRGTLDFSNTALQASEKALLRLQEAIRKASIIKPSIQTSLDIDIEEWIEKCYLALDDDFNTPILIAHLFEAVKWINLVDIGKETIAENDLQELKETMHLFAENILGLVDRRVSAGNGKEKIIDPLMELILQLRKGARETKNYTASDLIRDQLNKLKIMVKDTKDGAKWDYEE